MLFVAGLALLVFVFLSIHRVIAKKKRSGISRVGGSFILSLIVWSFLISIPAFFISIFQGKSNAASIATDLREEKSKLPETTPSIQSVWYDGAETQDSGTIYVCLNQAISIAYNWIISQSPLSKEFLEAPFS